MKIKTVNSPAGGPDQVFVIGRNVSGTTVSAHVPAQWDIAVATDGIAFTACLSGTGSFAGLFAGITDAAFDDSAHGLIQVYGFRQSAYVSRACAGVVPPVFLVPAGAYFDNATMSGATTSGHTMVTLMETIAASAAYSSAAQLYTQNVFIRAMTLIVTASLGLLLL